MSHDSSRQREKQLPIPTEQEIEQRLTVSTVALMEPVQRRGRPARLLWNHLCYGIVIASLRGLGAQLGLWRLLCLERVGPFERVLLSDQAVYNRLPRAASPMASFFEQMSGLLRAQLCDWQDRRLAPFAHSVLALDESPLDVVGRWLPQLRPLLCTDPDLLAGRISALFDVRLQQWVRVDLLGEAAANCKLHARDLLSQVGAGTLLLFDRGYLSFPFFDDLSERGLWWISRYANHATMQVRHVLYQGDGVLDAIVLLGRYRADRAKYPVRLVQFYVRGHLHRYLSNVLDPEQLSLADIAALYARRWDIELAFTLLKEHLHVNQLWSAKWSVICVQIWAGLLLAQLFHGLQVQLAAQAGVEPFEVSVDLLVQLVPSLLSGGLAPVPTLLSLGRHLGVIRPSSRIQVQVPFVDPSWIRPAPAEVLLPRERVRYAQRKCQRGSRRSGQKAG